MNTVQSVIVKKQGVGQKGPWTMYEATLDNGVKASGFEHVMVGEHVEVKQEGKYLNYTKVATNGASATKSNNGGKDDYWQRKEQRDIEQQPMIMRQHSQHMAMLWFALVSKYDSSFEIPTTEQLRGMISWFQRDINHSPVKPLPPTPEDIAGEQQPSEDPF